MTVVNWSDNVNNNFFGMTVGVKDNVFRQEFESGKVKTYLKNSTPKKTFGLNFMLHSQFEESAFWNWYTLSLKSGANALRLTNLLTNSGTQVYLMTSTPSVEGQFPKTVTIELEEY